VKERLQKILARAGYGSRRSVETLITAGRVSVNGVVVAQLGTQADVNVDRVEVDGAPIALGTDMVYLAMNKPAGFVTTLSDPQRRRTVIQLLPPDLPPHVVPIGRLDRDTEGLLLFSNDGEFVHRMSHPRFEVEKEYLALVEGRPTTATLRQLEQGIVIDGDETAPARAALAGPPPGYEPLARHTWISLVIHQGRKRQVRRMLASVGHQVRALVRVRVGDVNLGRLAKGTTRKLNQQEVTALRRAIGLSQ
jgi:23S rRNA pseudouridine2605 synthase